MNEPTRRRRLRETTPDEPRGPLPLLPLLVVVVLVGLGIGALLSRHFHGSQISNGVPGGDTNRVVARTAEPAPPSAAARRALPPTATPAPRPTVHRVALGTPKPKPVARATETPVIPTAAPPASPLPTPVPHTAAPHTAAPRTAAPHTAAPHTPLPRPSMARTAKPSAPRVAAQPAGAAAAAEVGRSYLAALIRGDLRTANTALGRGPDNTDFSERAVLDSRSRITDLHTTSNGDGTYKVEAEVAGSKGTFFVTMQVARNEANAYYISDHYAVRIQ